jgi:chromosomal replication initiation ATPase DnaA
MIDILRKIRDHVRNIDVTNEEEILKFCTEKIHFYKHNQTEEQLYNHALLKLGKTNEEVNIKRRYRDVVIVRIAIAKYIYSIKPDSKSVTVGKLFDRDHATVLHYLNLPTYPDTQKIIDIIRD